MQPEFNPSEIEAKWQKKWEEKKVYEMDFKKAKDPYYCLVMFPYPSGARLHVGHWYMYSVPDSFSRFQKMRGKDVFHPMGFDAFGLPAENFAISTGTPPAESTEGNVGVMIEQFKRMGCMYDWSKTLNTSKPDYYKWTQWLFLKMFEKDLAYRKDANVNWCSGCKTVLANEQVWEGKCERCDTDIILKPMTQWYWKTKEYAQKLLDNLEELDWPEKTKIMQKNWIGRSEGMNFKFKVKDSDVEFEVYDSVPQTFRAQTFAVIAPEHPLLTELIKGQENEQEVLDFIERVKKKKATKKYNFEEDLEGVFTGRYVEFVTGDLPLWVASFAVMDYGTGIVNCSVHDERDFAFAKKYDIPLHVVMVPEDEKEAKKVKNLEYCFTKDPDGIMLEPEEFKGRRWGEVRGDIIKYIEKEGIGYPVVQYRLRDWTISGWKSTPCSRGTLALENSN
jgi:leucyl-tRNA synthetase